MLELFYTCALYCYSVTFTPVAEVSDKYYYTDTYLTFGIESDTIGVYLEPYIYAENEYLETGIILSLSVDFWGL